MCNLAMIRTLFQKLSIPGALGTLAVLLCPTMVHAQAAAVDAAAPRFGVDFNTPRHGDDERSFGRVTGFIPIGQTPGDSLTFVETGLRLNSVGELGGTLTLGQRFLRGDVVLGGHLSYDIRDTGANTFNQLGLGVEVFGDLWDVHLNGYLPVGDTQQSAGSSGRVGQVTGAEFQGNRLLLGTGGGTTLLESAWGGFDLEAGMQLADWEELGQLWGYGGVYYHGDAVGGRLWVDHRVEDWMRLGLGIQSDDNFGTRGFFSIGFSWGGGAGSGPESEPDRELAETTRLWGRAAEGVTRNSSIVVRESAIATAGETVVAINPATGQAYTFRHVTPDSTSTAGDGTAEQPAANVGLITAQAGDIIYVREGDSRTNPLPAFTVPGGVVAISDAIAETITTQIGDITIPGTGTRIFPVVDGTGSNAAILLTGGNNRLSGFEVTGGNDANILVDSSDNARIENNISRAGRGDGIEVVTSSNVVLTLNTVRDNAGDGINIENSPSTVVSNNRMSGNGGSDVEVIRSDNTLVQNNTIINTAASAIEVATSAAVAVTENSIVGGDLGISIVAADIPSVQRNRINDTAGAAIAVSTSTGSTIDANQISNSRNGAIILINSSGTTTISNNAVAETATAVPLTPSNRTAPAAITLVNVTGIVNVTTNIVTGTTGTNNPLDGQGIALGNTTGDVALTISNNQVNNNQGDGIGVALLDPDPTRAGNANANVTITGNNTVSNNGVAAPVKGDGIKILVEEDGQINRLLIADNILGNNVDDGIDISLGTSESLLGTVSNAEVLNAIIQNNTIINSQNGPGIILRSAGNNSNLEILVDNNTLTSNGALAPVPVGLEATSADTNGDGSTRLCLQLTNNNSDNGYRLTETAGSTFIVINRSTLNTPGDSNTGTVNFVNNAGDFDEVPSLTNC